MNLVVNNSFKRRASACQLLDLLTASIKSKIPIKYVTAEQYQTKGTLPIQWTLETLSVIYCSLLQE